MPSPPIDLQNFAERYTAAWCSQNAASVAAFYSPSGSLCINAGTPAVGRSAITNAVQEFMTAFPDLHVRMDALILQTDSAVYHWTLTGTNSGPGGSDRPVRFSGFETWKINPEGLIAESQGSFDYADYQRQVTR
jgi:SnoaL-like polyketide cyclase